MVEKVGVPCSVSMDHQVEIESLKSEVVQAHELWQEDAAKWQARQTALECEVSDLKANLVHLESTAKKEAVLLTRRMKTADTLLGYLKSKAKIMSIPRYAQTSCGIKQQDGIGLVDKRGVPMAKWGYSENVDFDYSIGKGKDLVCGVEGENSQVVEKGGEGEYVERMALTVMQITAAMEMLLKRAIVAETEVDGEREKSLASQEEVVRKTVQIDSMWARVEEMERVAMGTSGVLKEMQLKLEDMEQETSKQRQRAAENEQELSRVRHDFGVLQSSVDNLVKARETIRCMEKRIHEAENVSERLTARVSNLESGKRQKDTEIEKLLLENDRLRGALDLKEAELSALGEQVRILVDQPSSAGSHLTY